MATNRTIEIGAIWANGAPDPPPVPITGTTYANSGISEATIEAGWKYKVIQDAADFNEVFQRATALLKLLEENGIMPWSSLTTYSAGAWARASDDKIYRALQASGNKDPISNPTYWVDDTAAHAALTTAHGSTSLATASTIMQRDTFGRAKVAAPGTSTDIALKSTVDTHAGLSTAHQSTSAATANRIIQRDASGRAKVAAPSASTDIALLSNVETHAALNETAHNMDSFVTGEISTHNGILNAHGATKSVAANAIIQRTSTGTAKCAAPSLEEDIALKSTVTADVAAHANETQGAHGGYGGQVDSAGTSVRLPGGWSSSRTGTGTYLITHNLGHTNYSPIASPTQTFREATIGTITTTTFQVKTHKGAENVEYALADSGFTFVAF